MTEESLAVDTSFAQQSLWLQNEISPGQSAYNVTAAVRLRGPLDTGVLEQALNTVVERHEALRTVFDLDGDDPVQVIGPMPPLTVPVLDTTPEAFEEVARAELKAPFDLRKGPLVRLRLLRLGTDDHVALLVMHHIVTDGVSSAILFQELTAAYQAHLAGRPPVLPELPIQYADFAVWQRDRLAGGHLQELSDYWAGVLAGAVPPRLPSDRPRPAVPTDRGGAHHFRIPAPLVTRVETLARKHNATPFMVLLAAFNVLLSRYSGQDDITVASPMSGRTRPELEGLIGYFVNPLLLRTDLSGDPSFLELLARVRSSCLGAFKHQELPFEQAVDLLRQQSPSGLTPPAQVMMVLQAKAPARWQTAGLTFEMVHVDTGTSKADLILDVRPEDDGHHVVLQYSTDLFDAATAERIGNHFVAALEGIADQPSRPVSELALLSAEERDTLLTRWNSPAAEQVTGEVHRAADEWATRTPDAAAVVAGDGRLSHLELNRRAEALAEGLRTAGVRPGTTVALAMEPSAALAVAALATLKAGGTCFPLDPELPERVTRLLLAESGAAFVLTDATAPNPVTDPDACGEPGTESGPHGLALLAWTATGGGDFATLGLTHSALLTAARDSSTDAPEPGHSVLFPARQPEQALLQLFSVLARGATLVLPGAPEDAVSGATALSLAGTLPETAGAHAVHPQEAGGAAAARRVPGHDLYVLDDRLEPVPFGVAGELCVGGAALSPGFRGRPGYTAARFVPDPHGARSGGRLLLTGERARRLPDGTVELLGRTDGLLTVDGLRVDPTEAGRVLAGLGGVGSCTVVVRSLSAGGPLPVAYVVPAPGERVDTSALLELLSKQLPPAWLPAGIVEVESIPRTACGDVDAAALPLPVPDTESGRDNGGYTAPRTPFEEEVARIWADLLGVEQVGAYDNFFDLGGQSLTAVRLAARLRDEFGVDIVVRDLYADFTVAEVAWKVLQRLVAAEAEDDRPVTD